MEKRQAAIAVATTCVLYIVMYIAYDCALALQCSLFLPLLHLFFNSVCLYDSILMLDVPSLL